MPPARMKIFFRCGQLIPSEARWKDDQLMLLTFPFPNERIKRRDNGMNTSTSITNPSNLEIRGCHKHSPPSEQITLQSPPADDQPLIRSGTPFDRHRLADSSFRLQLIDPVTLGPGVQLPEWVNNEYLSSGRGRLGLECNPTVSDQAAASNPIPSCI
jgi:hypothetical protein